MRLCDCVDSDREHNWNSPLLMAAYQAARDARFGHGETPVIAEEPDLRKEQREDIV
ncbi:hypothetical protein [Shimazuella kribbensis]|uniref:hypothetical protein n=1 Tax=Shimazuella kribbensis TaxID=139808 RepID=UPI0003F54724|nr:hypothetical protein [Shimazuella kribbensis]